VVLISMQIHVTRHLRQVGEDLGYLPRLTVTVRAVEFGPGLFKYAHPEFSLLG
jgi:hypothetical protein